MAIDMVTLRVPAIVKVTLPKGAGEIEVNLKKIHESIGALIVAHGIGQKVADSAVNAHVKGEKLKSGKLREEKESDVMFDSLDAMRKGIREKAFKILGRWESGEWNLPGGAGTRDPLTGEVWARIFATLGVPSGQRADLMKLGLAEAYLKVAKGQAKREPASKAEAAKWVEKVEAALRAAAEKVIAARATDLVVEL